MVTGIINSEIVNRADFADHFRKIIIRYSRIGYHTNGMRRSACLVINPITVNNIASLVSHVSDSMMGLTKG